MQRFKAIVALETGKRLNLALVFLRLVMQFFYSSLRRPLSVEPKILRQPKDVDRSKSKSLLVFELQGMNWHTNHINSHIAMRDLARSVNDGCAI